jgi:putative oxidoreductase
MDGSSMIGRLLFEGWGGGKPPMHDAAPGSSGSASGRPGGLFGQYVVVAMRILVAAVFIYAALHKIDKPLLFAEEIRMYRIIGFGPVLYLTAIVLPWIELFCGLAILSGLFIRGGALILTVLNVVFISVVLYRTLSIMSANGTSLMDVYFDCGCGFGATYAWKKLIEDAVLLVCSATIFFSSSYRFIPVIHRRD